MELQNEDYKPRGRRPGQRRRTKLEIARDRSLINRLRLFNRKSLSEISETVSAQYLTEIVDQDAGTDKDGKRIPHVGLKQVRNELEGAVEDFKETRADEIYAKRLEVIRRYETIAGLAADEYEKSKGDRVIETFSKSESDNPEIGTTETSKTVREPRVVGDKGYLNIIVDCTNKIAELEAVIPPRKTALTSPDGTEPFKFEGTEELKRLAALAEELLAPESGDKVKGG